MQNQNFKSFFLLSVFIFLISDFGFSQQVQWASKVINYSSQKEFESYSAKQVLGEPNSMPNKGYCGTAWEATNDERKEFLHVGFDKPMKIKQVIIAENYNPGAVYKVVAYDTQNAMHEIYSGKPDSTLNTLSRFFQIKIDETTFEVNAIKIFIDCRVIPGINQIDAIGIADNQDEIKSEIKLATNIKTFSEVEKLSDRINSPYQEICPIIAPDGKTLFFARKDYPPHIDRDHIWYSTAQDLIEWNKALFMPPPLNNKNHNAIGSITPDGNTVLLSNQYFKDETAHGDGWSISHKTSDGWGFPENARIKNFSNTDNYFNCFMGNSGKEIIMNVHRPDTRGETDLYVSFLQPDGSWSEPKNLGPELNSAGGECCAFLASDEKTLYFSSDGYNGYGSNDLYVSRRLDDTWQHWSAPANMGEPINSDKWDAYYSLAAKGDYAYFVRSGDIYRVRIAPEVQPEPVLLVYGTVYNQKTKEPVGDASIRYEYLSDGKVAGIASSTPVTGEYKIVLPYGSNYGFLAKAKKFISVSDNLDATSIKEYAEVKRDLYLVPAEVGEVIRLNNIFFDFAKAELKSESFPELDRVVLLLNDNSEMNIALGGHTDNVGSDDANLRLSQERINSVQNYLLKKGIAQQRLTATGYGETKPIASNETDEGRAQNRRVEFMIVK